LELWALQAFVAVRVYAVVAEGAATSRKPDNGRLFPIPGPIEIETAEPEVSVTFQARRTVPPVPCMTRAGVTVKLLI
jgi:hypothetical protein